MDKPLGTQTGRINYSKVPFQRYGVIQDCEECYICFHCGEAVAVKLGRPLPEHTCQLHPHTNCPYCNGTLAFAKGAVSDTELVEWFVREGWRQSKQELVAKLRKDFNVTKK